MFGQAVMLGEAIVDEGVIAVEEIGDAAVFADDVGEEHFGLLPHGFAEGPSSSTAGLAKRRGRLGGVAGLAVAACGVGLGIFRGLPSGGGFSAWACCWASRARNSASSVLHLLFLAIVAGEDQAGVDGDAFDIAGLEPLACEIVDEARGRGSS